MLIKINIKENIQNDEQKLVVHNPAQGIEYPSSTQGIFGVVEIAGFQYKVAKDDIIVTEFLKNYDINDSIVFDRVLLIGTKYYTSIGRPIVDSAKVISFIINFFLLDKILFFFLIRLE